LQSQGNILEGHGLVTAQEQSNESNEGQQQGWHLCMLLHSSVLLSDGIMANDSLTMPAGECDPMIGRYAIDEFIAHNEELGI
jgi:hypothetical protein